jgi:uncharacterized phiE125 gp8 family phage protein
MSGSMVVTPPAELVVSVATMKSILVIDHNLDDTMLAGMIAAVTNAAQKIMARSLVTQTRRIALNGWPVDGQILLDYPPVQSIVSVKYYDAANTLQTVPSANYVGVFDEAVPYVHPAPGKAWPGGLRAFSAVRVEYVAGYGTAAQLAAIEPDIVQTIQGLIAVAYENRESITNNAAELYRLLEDKLTGYKGWETP